MTHKPENLLQGIMVSAEIICTVPDCNETDLTTNPDEDEAAKLFFQRGWRGTNNNTYCPKHAEEKLTYVKKEKAIHGRKQG